MKKKKTRICTLFNCDRRHGNVCCADCGFRPKCKNSCQNEPEKCGCVKGDEDHEENAYDAGREDGLYLALKIVREGGLEALEKEIRFRNITGIKTSLAMKEIEGATQEIKNNVIDTIW